MKSFKRRLLNGFFWRLLLYVSSFILNICIAHSFGAAKSGIFYLLLNNLAFVVLLLGLGIDSAVAYFTSRKEVGVQTLLTLSVVWSVSATVLAGMLYTVALSFSWIPGNELGGFLIFYTGSTILANCLAGILYSSEDNITPNLIFTIVNILLLALIQSDLFSEAGLLKIFFLVSGLHSLALLIYIISRNNRLSFKSPGNFWIKSIFSFSFKAFLYTLLYALLLRCDYWLVNYFCSASELGNYLQATKLNQVVLLVPALASFSLFPLVVSHIQQDQKIDTKLVKLVTIYFYIGLVICVGIISFGYWVFPWLYGKTFSAMYGIFVLLSPGILALAAAYPLTTFFSGKNMFDVNIKALIFSIIIIIGLDLLLIPLYGTVGAAIASTVAYGFYFFYLLSQFSNTYRVTWRELLNIRKIMKENMPGLFN